MSCPDHPQWYHDREDCPFCLALEIRALQEKQRENEALRLDIAAACREEDVLREQLTEANAEIARLRAELGLKQP